MFQYINHIVHLTKHILSFKNISLFFHPSRHQCFLFTKYGPSKHVSFLFSKHGLLKYLSFFLFKTWPFKILIFFFLKHGPLIYASFLFKAWTFKTCIFYSYQNMDLKTYDLQNMDLFQLSKMRSFHFSKHGSIHLSNVHILKLLKQGSSFNFSEYWSSFTFQNKYLFTFVNNIFWALFRKVILLPFNTRIYSTPFKSWIFFNLPNINLSPLKTNICFLIQHQLHDL